jgi:hypothetical protein
MGFKQIGFALLAMMMMIPAQSFTNDNNLDNSKYGMTRFQKGTTKASF